MDKKIGSLSKPVTITISGESGSGKAVIAAFINKKLEELGAKTSFDIITDNEKLNNSKESFWVDTKKFVSNESNVILTNKEINIIIE